MHEGIGVGEPQRLGYGVLFFEQEDVAVPTGAAMQFNTGGEHEFVRVSNRVVIAGKQRYAREFGPANAMHVAHSASAVLEIGFKQERHLARLFVTLADAFIEFGQPTLRPLLPSGQALLPKLVGK